MYGPSPTRVTIRLTHLRTVYLTVRRAGDVDAGGCIVVILKGQVVSWVIHCHDSSGPVRAVGNKVMTDTAVSY